MTYQHCPRCRLAIRCRATYLMMDHCPRCLARAAVISPLFCSPLDADQLRVVEASSVSPAAGQLARRDGGRLPPAA
jgi:tRNA G26 N,N-dimethylase Trm1